MRDKDLNWICGIYRITNKLNGKFYIGSAQNLLIRAKQHFYYMARGGHPNRHLQRSFDKNGRSAFEFSILMICDDKDLLFFEQRFLDALKPCYNICKVAGNAGGRIMTAEHKAKISESVKRTWAGNEERRLKQAESNRAIKHSAETRELISKRSKEMWSSDGFRERYFERRNEGLKYA